MYLYSFVDPLQSVAATDGTQLYLGLIGTSPSPRVFDALSLFVSCQKGSGRSLHCATNKCRPNVRDERAHHILSVLRQSIPRTYHAAPSPSLTRSTLKKTCRPMFFLQRISLAPSISDSERSARHRKHEAQITFRGAGKGTPSNFGGAGGA